MNPIRKAIVGSALLLTAAGGVAGLAFSGSASAATDTADTSTVEAATDTSGTGDTAVTPAVEDDSTTPGAPHEGTGGPHAANGVTEEVLTGDTAASVEAAVLAAYPDATIERMETDAEGATYEAHVTLADGSNVTVKLDANFVITETVDGCG